MRYSKGLRREHKKSLKKKQIVTEKTMICGIDLAKKRHAFHVLDGSRNLLMRGKIPHSLEGMEQLLKELESLRQHKTNCERILFFMEGASHFWMSIASLLERRGYEYHLVENKAVGHQRHLAGQSGHKNDPRDAAHIADLGSSLHFTFSQLPLKAEWIDLRACAHEYQELVNMITAEKNRIHAFLGTIFPGYYNNFHDPFKKNSLAILQSLNMASVLDKEEFVIYVRKVFMGKNLLVKRCKAIWDYVHSDDPWGYIEARSALLERIKSSAERMQFFLKQQEHLRKHLLSAYRQIPYNSNLDSIQGSSSVENAVLLGILGDPKLFDEARATVSLAGLDAGEKTSGQYHGKTRITKVGRIRLRRAAVSAAMTVLQSRKNPDFVRRFFYLQQRNNRPRTALQALCACAGKYLRTVWWLCTTNTEYKSELAHHGFSKNKVEYLERELDEMIFETIN
jgi:transposase